MSHDHNRDPEPGPDPTSAEASNESAGETRPERDATYKVGYGKPPKHTQFKPGQCPNPRGRPKKRQNVRTMILDVLNQPVPITQNGKKKTVPALKATYQKVLGEALLKGNIRAVLLLTQLAERAGLMNDDDAPTAAAPLSREEEQVMAALARRLGLPSGSGQPSVSEPDNSVEGSNTSSRNKEEP
jgi:hypothetical protein